jgi:integrase
LRSKDGPIQSWAHNPKVVSSNLTPATISLRGSLERYLQEVQLLRKPGTLRECVRICNAAIPYLNAANPRDGVLSYLVSRKPHIESRTLENERIRVIAFCKHAGLKIEPKIPKFKFVAPTPEMYKPGELDAIFGAALPREHALYKLLLQAGLRMQEAMNLTYSCLRDDGIAVEQHGEWVPKDHEARTVKVPRSLIISLRGLPPIGDSNLVFPTPTGILDWHMLRVLKRTAKRAGLNPDKCWLHKFRANFCTTLLRAGMSIQDVMKQMGHANVKSTMRYMALLEGDDMQAKVESIWEGQ